MFHRYLIIVAFTIAVITGAILLTFSISTHAYPVSRLVCLDNPQEVTARLIMKTIDNYNPHLSEDQKKTICQTIMSESNATNFDPFFIAGVIAAESSFVPSAVSPCSAQGLMQLTTAVAGMMQIENPFDIKENIYAGTRYLQQLHGKFQNPDLTLAAYNAGPTRVARLGRIPRISETINYISKVQRFYRTMQARFQTTMLSLTAYPLCFQFESAPATRNSLTSGSEERTPTDNSMNSGPVIAFFESKRYLKYGKLENRGCV
jgi:hypothetical protein